MSTSTGYEALLSPLTIDTLTLRNRVIMAPLTRSRSAPTNIPNDVNKEYYIQRSRGGSGLIITEGILVSQQGYAFHIFIGTWCSAALTGLSGRMHPESGTRNK